MILQPRTDGRVSRFILWCWISCITLSWICCDLHLNFARQKWEKGYFTAGLSYNSSQCKLFVMGYESCYFQQILFWLVRGAPAALLALSHRLWGRFRMMVRKCIITFLVAKLTIFPQPQYLWRVMSHSTQSWLMNIKSMEMRRNTRNNKFQPMASEHQDVLVLDYST